MPCGPLIDSWDETHHNDAFDIEDSYPCAGANFCAVGQCFTTPEGQRYEPCSVKFYLKRKGQPSGSLYVYLYDVTGTCGTDCVPDPDEFLCATISIDAMSISQASFTLYEFTFKGCPCLQTNHCYAVVLMGWGIFDGNNHIEVGINKLLAPDGHEGNTVIYRNSNWEAQDRADTIFYIYGVPCGSADEGGSAPLTSPSTEQAKITGPRKTILYNLEHMVLHVRSPLGKNITFPCWIHGFVGRLSQPIVVVVKAGLGVPAFFETVVRAGIKRCYEETLHLQSKLGIKYAETLVMKEDVRGHILTQKAVMKNFQESLINFMESLSRKQYEAEKDMEVQKKKQKKKDKLRELINNVKEVD